jgi:mannose-6-phosphate isomerase-like protein (cupin superfamily)
VTALANTPREGRELTLPAIDSEIMVQAVEQYLVSPIFRAARYEELVLDDNPYRRPVRPDDIGLVDFSAPLGRGQFSQLSGLMGNRMLLNIYDTDKLFLPRNPTDEKWRDYRQFYAEKNRFLGDLIRPYLEAHVFGFVREEAAERVTGEGARVVDRLAALAREQDEAAGELGEVLSRAADREAMLQMLAIQSLATRLNTGGRPASALRALPGSAALPDLLGAPEADDPLAEVALRHGIKDEPHSYYQYYLPSTLALMNYMNRATRDPGEVFALAGALAAHASGTRALADALAPLVAGTSGGPGQVRRGPEPAGSGHAVVELMDRVGGDFGVREFARGLEEYAVLLDVHHEDLMRQFTWIEAMPPYVDKARRLQAAITEHQIPVDLDTFVESWEECSTTHVHDDDRLLVIESGEMEFWNCFGMRHKLRAGDMTFIPKHRLHGSVVLTGECVYHQPVITADLDRRFG